MAQKVSVVTPSYKQIEWLRLCAASVADQIGIETEHIVQDGGSGAEVERWAASECGVQLHVERDRGMYDAINRGLHKATGDICGYLNCDEQYLLGALRTAADFFDAHPEVDVLFGDAILIDTRGNPLAYRRTVLPGLTHTWWVHLCTLSCAMFFRHTLVERGLLFDPQYRAIGDVVWIGRLLRERVPMAVLHQPLAVFTLTGKNLGREERSGQEMEQCRKDTADLPPRFLRAPAIIQHRLKRFAAGAYNPQECRIRIYTQESPNCRKFFFVPRLSYRWPHDVQNTVNLDTREAAPCSQAQHAEEAKIVAVFATFNRRDTALLGLDHLKRQTHLAHTIAVDNGSTDGTADAIRNWQKQNGDYPVELITSESNLGNPGAIGLAVRRALEVGADWVWLLDDDAWPCPDALEKLVHQKLNPDYVFSSLVIDSKTGNPSWPVAIIDFAGQHIVQKVSELPSAPTFEIRGAWLGALISRRILEEVGEIESAFFIRGEDEDYPARIRQRGFRCLCVKDSVVYHPPAGQMIRVTILGRSFFYEVKLAPWKAYYTVRNHTFIRKKYSRTPIQGWLKGLSTILLAMYFGLLLDDRKLSRMRLYLLAGWHGLTGRLGKVNMPLG